jgi:hypothetical protein
VNRKILPQEGLKLVACLTMLIDHIGAVFVPGYTFRIIGRIAYPIYCFLLAEGVTHTRNRKQYGIRLLMAMFLAEIPFDLLFFGRITWEHQSVMVTLLLGFLYAVAMSSFSAMGHLLMLLVPFAFLGELLHCDYGGWGVAMIGLFVITMDVPNRRLCQALCLILLGWVMGGRMIHIGTLEFPRQVLCVAAMIPICLYDGQKKRDQLWVRRMFYLFYPVHLLVLYVVRRI